MSVAAGSSDGTRAHRAGSRWWHVGAVVVVAFAVRWLFAVGMHIDVRGQFLLDMSVYDMLGRRLAAGEGYRTYVGAPALFFPPGYPMILGALYRVFGSSLVVAWTANAAFGALTCGLVHATASRLFGRGVGLTAAALLALFPSQIFLAAATLSEVAFGAALVAVLYLCVRWTDAPGGRRWFLFGAAVGAASLIRGVALPFLVVPAVLWASTAGLRVAVRRTALAAAGLALVVLPWTARNWAVTGAPILLSTDGATALFIGHNPLADGTETTEMLALARREWPWLERLPPPERDVVDAQLKIRYALRYWLTHPWHELTLIPKRLGHLYGREYHVPANMPLRLTIGGRTLGGDALDDVAPVVADAYFGAAVVLALAGLPSALRAAHPAARLVPLAVAYFTLLHGVVFFASPRYHAPMVPLFCILAALALHRLGGRLPALQGRRRLEPAGQGAWSTPIRSIVPLLVLALTAGCVAPAGPPPGPRTIVCAGDSNSTPDGWCELLAAQLPPRDWRFVNVSIWGTSARGWVAKHSVANLVAPHRPDVVFFALGTNDVCQAPAEAIVDALLTLAVQAGGRCGPGAPCARVILATIPPTHLPPPLDDCRPTTERADALLRAAWPAHLLADFDGWVGGPEWYRPDGLHFTADGQVRRAAAALDALLAAIR